VDGAIFSTISLLAEHGDVEIALEELERPAITRDHAPDDGASEQWISPGHEEVCERTNASSELVSELGDPRFDRRFAQIGLDLHDRTLLLGVSTA
jgi:hypothetical protein